MIDVKTLFEAVRNWRDALIRADVRNSTSVYCYLSSGEKPIAVIRVFPELKGYGLRIKISVTDGGYANFEFGSSGFPDFRNSIEVHSYDVVKILNEIIRQFLLLIESGGQR